MLGPLAILCALLFPGGWAWNTLEQPIMVVAPAGSSATLPCKASSRVNYIHWYRLQEDESPDEDMSPKPTVFLPSVAERKIQNAGTYLCLLEDFFPDVIKIDWKEKDGKRILTSQQGDTRKTNDTYMKFSWLTVTGASLDKDHKCIVKHKSKKTGIDQEILFPSINKELAIDSTKYEDAALQLQLTNTSAYYTHVLLLVKSLVYSAIMAVCLLRRPALCGSGTSS
uniref:Ig-like domain-containing protein n=2 Tax=Ursus maritimus TaxID=29073 RepID=A0A452U2U4_URSMA